MILKRLAFLGSLFTFLDLNGNNFNKPQLDLGFLKNTDPQTQARLDQGSSMKAIERRLDKVPLVQANDGKDKDAIDNAMKAQKLREMIQKSK